MRVAVEGCCHGELDPIYRALAERERQDGKKADVLIICGDFQAIRNVADFESMAVPEKYRKLNTFYKYYKGEARAPVLTLVIGGNHEASNYMHELFYGGWLAPNIYYLGAAGVVRLGGLRIAGMSGIFKEHNYERGHFERPPYNKGSVRSVYHIRKAEVFKLLQLQQPLDIFLSHDWPRGVANCGFCDRNSLLRKKPFFKKEVNTDTLGNPAAALLLQRLRPKRWFSAHLHTRFDATVYHGFQKNDRTVAMCLPVGVKPNMAPNATSTQFLALDKCLPRREFLEVLDVAPSASTSGAAAEPEGPPQLEYDPEWLAILRTYHHLMSHSRDRVALPGNGEQRLGPSAENVAWVQEHVVGKGRLRVPDNFGMTAPPHGHGDPRAFSRQALRNAQTEVLMALLELPYNLAPQPWAPRGGPPMPPARWLPKPPPAVVNPEEIGLDDDDEEDSGEPADENPEEIGLDSDSSSGEDAEAKPGATPTPVEPAPKRSKMALPPPKGT